MFVPMSELVLGVHLREMVSNSQSSSGTQSARPLAQNIPFMIQDAVSHASFKQQNSES